MYKTKRIQFLGRMTPIILQNQNGACPLIAIGNVLLLRNNLALDPNSDEVSEEELMSLVSERLHESNSQVNNEGNIQNLQQNINDAYDHFPKLTTGIDVNIKFDSCKGFEYTPECAIFGSLDINLYHGWIVDPQDVQAANAIGSKSYNAIMAELSVLGTHEYGQARGRGEIIRNFLDNTKTQLTVFGLFCLQADLKERELCVFFRNNHFCTMFKYEGELYLLATDQGLDQPGLVWEKLNEVNGDTAYMTATFKDFKVDSGTSGASGTWGERNAVTTDYLTSINNVPDTGMEVNFDLELAIALQQQEFEDQGPRSNPTPQPPSVGGSRLVTGPQVPRSSHRSSTAAASRQEPRSPKDSKCGIL